MEWNVMRTYNHQAYGIVGTLGLVVTLMLTLSAPAAEAQRSFPSPEAAAEALVDGIAYNNDAIVKSMLGADYARLLPVHKVDSEDITDFLAAWAKSHRIVPAGDARAFLEVGTNGWTLPIPLVKGAAGWRFDTRGAQDEMRTRRIGRNELAAIQVVLAIADAQEEYAEQSLKRDGTKQFAQRLISRPGRRDGLYWPAVQDEPESPIGPLAANTKPGEAYHGYEYRILTRQGRDAPGGARSYVRNGRMTDGYAVLAWPAKWGDTGVMTFIVNHDGVVHECNLGPDTAARARVITEYNPDSHWKPSATK
jgi:hypothetical protein